jgi:uncharacterized protein (DUF2237 family)
VGNAADFGKHGVCANVLSQKFVKEVSPDLSGRNNVSRASLAPVPPPARRGDRGVSAAADGVSAV